MTYGEEATQPTDFSSGFNVIKTELPEIYVERTLAIIKPDAVSRSAEIEDIILRTGFTILSKRQIILSPEQASEFYAEHFGKIFFTSLIAYMSSGPVIVMVLARDKAIALWRELIGPTKTTEARIQEPESLRAIYGTDDQRNGLHGSDSTLSAAREIRFFFPDSIVEPIMSGEAAKEYMARYINPTLLKGLTELAKKKPEHAMVWLAEWLLKNNPYRPLLVQNQTKS